MPLASVIMPVYNAERFIQAAVDSILGQAFDDFEFIVVDDGSQDQSVALIEQYHDKRLRLLKNNTNAGIVHSLNSGIEVSSGQYIFRMDADDIAASDRFAKQIDFMERHRDVAVLGSNTTLIDERGETIGKEEYPQTYEEIRQSMYVHNPFAHSSVVIRRSVLTECGLYDRTFLHNEDYDLWLRIGRRHRLENLPDRLLYRRIHSMNVTVALETELVRFRIRTLAHAIRRYEAKPLYIFYLLRPMAAYLYRLLKKLV